MKLLLILSLAISAYAFTPAQTKLAKYLHEVGKLHGYGNSLPAIALVESNLGLYQIGAISADFGIMQISIKSHLAHIGVADTVLNRSKYATLLVTNPDYCINAALTELNYWKSVRNRTNYTKYIASYNQGNTISNYDYVRKVSNAIQQLKQANILQ